MDANGKLFLPQNGQRQLENPDVRKIEPASTTIAPRPGRVKLGYFPQIGVFSPI
jgi:hypothetical protein